MKGEPIVVLLVEDDAAHAEIVRRNFADCRLANQLIHVADGQAALDYLHHQNGFSDPATAPRPGIILLDLRLPKVNGLEVLQHIKTDPTLSSIPVVILTSSRAEEDIVKSYNLHANCYISKPIELIQFLNVVRSIENFWLSIVVLPHDGAKK